MVELHDLEMRHEAAARLVACVQHCALEAERRELGEESEVGLLVGEHHRNEADLPREPAQGVAKAIERRCVDRKLDVVDAHRGQRPRGASNASSS